MGCFLCNIFKGNDINIGIEEYKNTPDMDSYKGKVES